MSDEKTTSTTWGSWEELLLACAVKRHGFKNWDSVALEIRTKTSLPRFQTTAQCCKQKYHDLKRRFKAAADNIPWLEEQLRKVRVDELKQEVQRYDLSILSLQLKVKRLEEERDNTINTQQRPDLDNQNTTSLNDKMVEPLPEMSEDKLLKVSRREEESDRENRSVNESNSTGLSGKIVGGGGVQKEKLIKIEPEPVRSGGEGGPVEEESESKESEELGDSVTQLSSDVQSSASFGSTRKRKSDSGHANAIKDKEADAKSEPLIRLLEMIRTHKHASLFERRLKSQESDNYKETVRQHLDLETIQTRVGGGSSCILSFYRDLLLLFNNALVYFPNASLESETAHQLRNLISNEIKKETQISDSSQDLQQVPQQPQPKSLLERSDSLLAKSASIVVCRKRSSVSAKPSSSFAQKGEQLQRERSEDTEKPATDQKQPLDRGLLKVQTEEKKPVITGARSSRRSSRNLKSNTRPPPSCKIYSSRKQISVAHGSTVEKQETPKADKKKTTERSDRKKSETSDKKKSVVDFLKRIEKNSPVQTVKKNSSKGGNECNNGSEEQKRNNNSNNGKERVVILRSSSERKQAKDQETSPSRRSVGRPTKRTAEATKVSGKRGRESGGKETVASRRQSKSKRARR